jgi:hypothetical protein
MSAIIQKLQKLLALAEGGEEHEAKTARAMFKALLEKYKLNEDDVRATQKGKVNFRCRNWRVGGRIATALGLSLWGRRKSRGSAAWIEGTRQETDIFFLLYYASERLIIAKRKEFALALKSYTIGYLNSNYPPSDKNLMCPKCGKPAFDYRDDEERFICRDCGHRSRKSPSANIDPKAYWQGAAVVGPHRQLTAGAIEHKGVNDANNL